MLCSEKFKIFYISDKKNTGKKIRAYTRMKIVKFALNKHIFIEHFNIASVQCPLQCIAEYSDVHFFDQRFHFNMTSDIYICGKYIYFFINFDMKHIQT